MASRRRFITTSGQTASRKAQFKLFPHQVGAFKIDQHTGVVSFMGRLSVYQAGQVLAYQKTHVRKLFGSMCEALQRIKPAGSPFVVMYLLNVPDTGALVASILDKMNQDSPSWDVPAGTERGVLDPAYHDYVSNS